MASPINASLFEEFDITSSDGQRTVSLIGGILSFQYFENLLSPNVTAVLSIFNTGNTTNGQGLYNGLPVRGGERVFFKIKTPSEAELESDIPGGGVFPTFSALFCACSSVYFQIASIPESGCLPSPWYGSNVRCLR